jgi:hypothetical protein
MNTLHIKIMNLNESYEYRYRGFGQYKTFIGVFPFDSKTVTPSVLKLLSSLIF